MRHLRVERVAQMLEARSESMAEVASAVGVKSPALLSAAFRKVYGHSPTEHVENASLLGVSTTCPALNNN